MLLWSCVHKYLSIFFYFFGSIPRRGISGSDGNSVLNFLRNLRTAFHSRCTVLHYYQQPIKVLVSPHPHFIVHLFFFFIIDILLSVKWHFIVFLLAFLKSQWCWVSFRVPVDHLHIFKEVSLLTFYLNCFCCCWALKVLYLFWIVDPYWIYDVQIIFSCSVDCLFTFLMMYFGS